MPFSLSNSKYHEAASAMRLQFGATMIAYAVFLKFGKGHPLAFGISSQMASKITCLAEKQFPKAQSELLKFFGVGFVYLSSYALASKLDTRIQAICSLGVLLFDVKVIGLQNVWKELKS